MVIVLFVVSQCYNSCFVGLKLFGKAHVEVNVSLGQLINNPLFNEAESEFHVSSYFKTKIDIRNALHVSLTSSSLFQYYYVSIQCICQSNLTSIIVQ